MSCPSWGLNLRLACSLVAIPSTLPRPLSKLEYIKGHAITQFVEALCQKKKVAGSIPDGVIGNFH